MLMKMSKYEFVGGENGGDEDKVTEWEVGLPSIDDLTPLSQLLPELASAISISPDPDPNQDPMVVEADENKITDRDRFGSDPKRLRKDNECCVDIEVEEADSTLRNNKNDKSSAAAKISDS
nr:transcription factor pcl1 [Quercus suber]